MLCAELRSAGVAIDQELQPAEKPVTRKTLSFGSESGEVEEGEIVQQTNEVEIATGNLYIGGQELVER